MGVGLGRLYAVIKFPPCTRTVTASASCDVLIRPGRLGVLLTVPG